MLLLLNYSLYVKASTDSSSISYNITVPDGHWRISKESNAIFKCPYNEYSCLGKY